MKPKYEIGDWVRWNCRDNEQTQPNLVISIICYIVIAKEKIGYILDFGGTIPEDWILECRREKV
jgi:hypothetical protein